MSAAWCRRLSRRWGEIHILVNNAGINARVPIDADDDARWRTVLDSTVRHVAQHLACHVVGAEYRRIQHSAPAGIIVRVDRDPSIDAGVVDQDVDLPPARDNRLHQAADIPLSITSARKPSTRRPRRDLVRSLADRLRVPGAERHLRTLVRQGAATALPIPRLAP